jgi:hypothetical protein
MNLLGCRANARTDFLWCLYIYTYIYGRQYILSVVGGAYIFCVCVCVFRISSESAMRFGV